MKMRAARAALSPLRVFAIVFITVSVFLNVPLVPSFPPSEAVSPTLFPVWPPRHFPLLPPPEPAISNQWVRRTLDVFQDPNRREGIGLWLNRSGRYLEMIQRIFKQYGLPGELAYIAMVESGFDPGAVSPAGAKGLWQLMPQTARRYGLRVDSWVDERLHPEKSTAAAALYLRDLFDRFNSWPLAKAAYNAGERKVARALQESRTDDFWALARRRILPEETRRFVPSILAAMRIGKNPARYGFEVAPELPLRYDLVMAPPGLGLGRLAARTGISLEKLQVLNPELRRRVTPPGSSYALKVPAGHGTKIRRKLASLG